MVTKSVLVTSKVFLTEYDYFPSLSLSNKKDFQYFFGDNI